MSIEVKEKSGFNKAEYINEYKKKKYKRVPLDLKNGDYCDLKQYCDDFKIPCITFIKMCIKYCIENVHIDELKRYK